MQNTSLTPALQPALKRRDFRAAAALGTAAALLLGVLPAQAGTAYTDGGSTNVFSTAIAPTIVSGSSAANGDTLTFSGTSYTQTDDIASLLSFNALTFANTGAVTLNQGAGTTITLASTSGNTLPTVALNNSGTLNFNLNLALANTTTFSGTGSATFGGGISGAGGLTQSGTGTLTLSANNSFSGGLTINSGKVISTTSGGSTSLGTGNVTVNTGGTLQGNAGDSFGYNGGSSPALITIAGGTVTSGTNGNYTVTLPDLTFSGGGTLSAGSGNGGGGNGNFSTHSQNAGTAKFTVTNAGSDDGAY